MKNYKLIIKKKSVKNISIRITSFDEVVLTLPFFVSKSKGLEFLSQKESWIQKHLKNFPKSYELKEGAEFLYLGEKYTIKFHHDRDKKVFFQDGFLYVYHDRSQQVLDLFLKKQARDIFVKLIQKWEKVLDKSIKRVSIKKMKTRWGSCNTQKAYINLNLNLIHKSIDVIDYVILHEMAHLTHPNHSKEFHGYVAKFMADWKDREKLLKSNF